MYGSIKIQTELPFMEAHRRLCSEVKPRKLPFGYFRKTLVGKIRDSKVEVYLDGVTRNPLKPFFFGKLLSYDNSTILEGNFSASSFAIAIHILWIILLCYATLCTIGSIFGIYEEYFGVQFPREYFVLVPVFWISLILVVLWEFKMARREVEYIIRKFNEALNS